MVRSGNPTTKKDQEQAATAEKRTAGRPKGSKNKTVQHRAQAGETPRDKFLRLATYRMQHVLYAIRLLGNLSAPTYKYEEQDIKRMRGVLDDAINTSFRRFTSVEPRAYNFSFGSQLNHVNSE
jgi:hypothetical protein